MVRLFELAVLSCVVSQSLQRTFSSQGWHFCDGGMRWFSKNYYVCNGEKDCEDGSDESQCGADRPKAASYCDLDPFHTMCKYPGPSPSCEIMTVFRGLDNATREVVLDKHNQFRRKVAKGLENRGISSRVHGQPPAANMKELVWNSELEVIAQRWADQCNQLGPHDKVRNKLDGTVVGQNQAYAASTSYLSEEQVLKQFAMQPELWYSEVENPGFDGDKVDSFVYSSGIGHYAQIVWGDTEEVGCGLVYYKSDGWYTSLVICNYARSGNFMSKPVYKTGYHCSKCPDSHPGCNDGLCTKEGVDIEQRNKAPVPKLSPLPTSTSSTSSFSEYKLEATKDEGRIYTRPVAPHYSVFRYLPGWG